MVEEDGRSGAAGGVPTEAWGGGYRVRLDVFEGPLDLLLHLIKKNEVEITEIPVAAITEQYLAYLDLMRELNLDVAGEFLVMAATLVLLKSRMLLPRPANDDAEEAADPRSELVERLLEYQRYREAAAALHARALLDRDVFCPPPGAGTEAAGPVLEASVWELLDAFRRVLARTTPEPPVAIEAERLTLRDGAERIVAALADASRVPFERLLDPALGRQGLIVTFLALLELMRLGIVAAVQDRACGSIELVRRVEDIRAVPLDVLAEADAMGEGPA